MSSQTEQSHQALSQHQILIEQRKLEFEHAVQKSELLFKELSQAKDAFEQVSAASRNFEAELNKYIQGRHANQSKLSEMQ
ncbi:hypothetical protein ACEV9S_24420, partial [Vibrio parahaemolyticus]